MSTNPPHTRSTTNEDRVAALEVSNHSLRQQFKSQKEEFTTVKEGLEALTVAVAKMTRAMEGKGIQIDEPSNNNGRDNSSTNQNHDTGECSRHQSHDTHHGSIQTRFSYLDFPRFDGENPCGWIYKAEQFFLYQKTDASKKVLLASFHLQEEALQWYQWYEQSQPNVQWEEFTRALCIHFGPSDFEDFDEALAKL